MHSKYNCNRVIRKPRSRFRSRFATSSSPRGSFEVANLERNPERLHSKTRNQSFEVLFGLFSRCSFNNQSYVVVPILAFSSHWRTFSVTFQQSIKCMISWKPIRCFANLTIQSFARFLKLHSNPIRCVKILKANHLWDTRTWNQSGTSNGVLGKTSFEVYFFNFS